MLLPSTVYSTGNHAPHLKSVCSYYATPLGALKSLISLQKTDEHDGHQNEHFCLTQVGCFLEFIQHQTHSTSTFSCDNTSQDKHQHIGCYSRYHQLRKFFSIGKWPSVVGYWIPFSSFKDCYNRVQYACYPLLSCLAGVTLPASLTSEVQHHSSKSWVKRKSEIDSWRFQHRSASSALIPWYVMTLKSHRQVCCVDMWETVSIQSS